MHFRKRGKAAAARKSRKDPLSLLAVSKEIEKLKIVRNHICVTKGQWITGFTVEIFALTHGL